jgi:Holliday junction resolvase
MQETINVVKANGAIEPFSHSKLENSLLQAGADHTTADEIVRHVVEELKDGISTSYIHKHALFLLDKKLKPIAARYSLRRAIMDLGPSGFPFEDFVAHILREKGFEALTDQMIMGSCVPHEIDVIAWNENKLIMAEAKFHNELGLKSDLKIALYIKARFDDIKGMKYFYGKEREVDESWLITNTKFTTTATHYAECKGLTLIGWNYPKKGNLQDLIIDSGLHPLTCLTSISSSQKKMLLSRGVVLCKTISEDASILKSLGFNEEKAKKVLSEIEKL